MKDDFADEFIKDILKMAYKPNYTYKDCHDSRTPCEKCIGVDSCFIQTKRNPEEECDMFYFI